MNSKLSGSEQFSVERFTDWKSFRDAVSGPKYKSWAFRGQSNENWPLFSSLSRYLHIHNVHPDAWSRQEERILRIFKRKAHLLLPRIPSANDNFEWLAMMQHHGAPTRLLDFSWSPFVAAFFALEQATTDAAVWAVFPPGLNNRPSRTINPDQDVTGDDIGPWVEGAFEKYFLVNNYDLAVIGEPHNMNQRLLAQSGTFVMPGVLNKPIERLIPADNVVKFVLATDLLRKNAMAELYAMNISNATLFPGLDGLARSLAYELEHHWAFDPTTMEKQSGYQ